MMRTSFLDFLSDPVCPRCLTPLKNWKTASQYLSCPRCTFVIPLAYLRDVKKTPPIFVQLFGLPAVGKTTFLDMLRIQLYSMPKMWPGSFALPITQLDMDHRQILFAERARGVPAPSTTRRSRNQNEAYIMQLTKMDRWNSHFLVLMDFSGEDFTTLQVPVEDIPFLCQIPVTIMLMSIQDMQREGKNVEDVLTSYITTLESHGINFSRMKRQLIIVFNKADLISNLPPDVYHYLKRDHIYQHMRDNKRIPDMSGQHLSDYIAQMEYISNILTDWVYEHVPGGDGLFNILQHKKIGARFTAMSATGHDLSLAGKRLEPIPQRVLDPFFWVMQSYANR